MIEVCFNDSTKAILNIALKKEKIENNILGLTLRLSQGDILSGINKEDCKRKDIVKNWLTYNPYKKINDIDKMAEEFYNLVYEDLETLKNTKSDIRIWLSDEMNEMCGFLFVCDLLKEKNINICLVKMPKEIKTENGYKRYAGFFEVSPEEIFNFIKYEKVLKREELNKNSSKWQKLKNENTELRILENDKVLSANMNYYDDIIRKEFTENPKPIVHLIGMTIGNNVYKDNPVVLDDFFVAKRVEFFIENKELEITKKDISFYKTEIKKA